jgi:hypothetical protein
MRRLEGYLKNRKQPAPWENKVQAAFRYYPSRRGHSNVFKLIVDALKVKTV